MLLGALWGLFAPKTPWWSWACLALLLSDILLMLPGYLRNGYWGPTPSTSAWEQIKASEEAARDPEIDQR